MGKEKKIEKLENKVDLTQYIFNAVWVAKEFGGIDWYGNRYRTPNKTHNKIYHDDKYYYPIDKPYYLFCISNKIGDFKTSCFEFGYYPSNVKCSVFGKNLKPTGEIYAGLNPGIEYVDEQGNRYAKVKKRFVYKFDGLVDYEDKRKVTFSECDPWKHRVFGFAKSNWYKVKPIKWSSLSVGDGIGKYYEMRSDCENFAPIYATGSEFLQTIISQQQVNENQASQVMVKAEQVKKEKNDEKKLSIFDKLFDKLIIKKAKSVAQSGEKESATKIDGPEMGM